MNIPCQSCQSCGQFFDAANNPIGRPIGKACEPVHQGPFHPVPQDNPTVYLSL
jgi:hypothetical protein